MSTEMTEDDDHEYLMWHGWTGSLSTDEKWWWRDPRVDRSRQAALSSDGGEVTHDDFMVSTDDAVMIQQARDREADAAAWLQIAGPMVTAAITHLVGRATATDSFHRTLTETLANVASTVDRCMERYRERFPARPPAGEKK